MISYLTAKPQVTLWAIQSIQDFCEVNTEFTWILGKEEGATQSDLIDDQVATIHCLAMNDLWPLTSKFSATLDLWEEVPGRVVGQFIPHSSTRVQTTGRGDEECIGESIGSALAHCCT